MQDLDLKLKINSYSVKPGDVLSRDFLKAAGFKKVGFVGKLLLGRPKDQIVYHSTECKVSYLEDSNIIVPNPYIPYDKNNDNLHYFDNLKDFEARLQAKCSNKYMKPDLNGITYFCDTSAYYFLEKDYSVWEINFQLLNNIILAGDEYGKFIHLCNQKYGQPMYLYNDRTADEPGPGVTAGWVGKNSCIYANLSIDEKHFMIIWLTDVFSESYFKKHS